MTVSASIFIPRRGAGSRRQPITAAGAGQSERAVLFFARRAGCNGIQPEFPPRMAAGLREGMQIANAGW